MRFRRGITAAITGVMMLFGLTAVTAPVAQAASPCNMDTVWDLEETVRDGKYVIKNYSARYYTCSRIIVKRTDNRKINVSLRIRRDFVNKNKQDTTKKTQILGKRRVTRYFLTDNVWIDVSVWASLASRNTMPYRGTTTLKRT